MRVASGGSSSFFARGEWVSMLAEGEENASRGSQAGRRRRREDHYGLDRRTARAEFCVQFVELSSAREALEGVPAAPRSRTTLRALRDPRKRLAEPRDPFPQDVLEFQPVSLVEFDVDRLSRTRSLSPARGSRRAVKDVHRTCPLFAPSWSASATRQLQAEWPSHHFLRMGRCTGLLKPGGGVRCIVTGDIFRRLVARCVAH